MTRDLGTLHGELLVFGGVYSNLQALEAVRGFAKTRGIPASNVICTGDIVGYCADPTPCVELIRDWGIRAIAGNVELNIRDGREDCGCNFDDDSACDLFSRIWYPYAREHSSAAAVAYMHTLPDYLEFAHAGRRVRVVHGNYGEVSQFVWRSTPWSAKAAAFGSPEGRLREVDTVLAGHAGVPFAHGHGPKLWLNAGVVGMPANDGTREVWCATLDAGWDFAFHRLSYDYATARRRMLAQPLPKAYALTLENGLWDNTEIMPPHEAAWTGHALDPHVLRASATGPAPTPPPPSPDARSAMDKTYYDPKDLKRFGRIKEFQPEMGRQFFEWYENATYGDTALTQREKALIALAVSHAIACPYCIDAFTTNSLESGADEEQMMEAVHVAAAIRAGTTLINSVQMVKQAEKLGM